MQPYIIWNVDRTHKTIILIDDNEAAYDSLLLKVSSKLDINGTSLVLESNGTPIDDLSLPYFKSEILMILQSEEKWEPSCQEKSQLSGWCSTITVNSESANDTANSDALSTSANQEVPVSSDETIIITESVDCNSENFWNNFEIPWEKLNLNQMQTLQNGIKDNAIITRLTQIIVDEMRCFKKLIPIKAFKRVSKKVIDTFPKVFVDVDRDGIILGDGSHKIVQKLIDRNNYLNRTIFKTTFGDKTNLANKKRFFNARAGCSNWAPEIHPSKRICNSDRTINDNDAQFYEVLENNYPEIRHYLNSANPPTIQKIREDWPIILSSKSIKWHFNKLTTSNIDLLDRLIDDSETINSIWKKKFHGKKETNEGDIDLIIKNLIYIAEYFSENFEEFFFTYKESSDIDLQGIPLTPSIILTGGEKENKLYLVFVEHENINVQGYDSFLEALKVAFSLYFILNLKYPTKLQATFELLQRMYLKIHPDAGSKSRMKVTLTKRKVLNLMRKFIQK